MKFFRCEICGEVYMASARPSNCAHCGAPRKYLVLASDWTDEDLTITELSAVSRSNLEKALQLEVNNAPFYRDAAANAKSVEMQGVLRCLGRIEAEHASVIRKILNCPMPKPEPGREKATDDEQENLRLAHEREVFAADFYLRAANNAVEPRVKKVLKALSEIENDHVEVEEDFMGGGEH